MSLNSEEAIYRITRAVYERLGERAERQLVEALVSDIYAALQPAFDASPAMAASNFSAPAATPEASPQRFIISVFGLDRAGIVAAVASLLGEANCSIVDINQTVVQGKFAMIMIIDAARATRDVAQLREVFRALGERLGVRIYLQREDIFHAMHRV
jgi:ACT domain-containing protein